MGRLDDCYMSLKEDLELVLSVLLSLDAWTSPNHIPVFAIIGYWIIPHYVKRVILFEFQALKGVHSGENMAGITFGTLDRLDVLQKLLAITADNTLNNNTLVEHLHYQLLEQFDDEVDLEYSNARLIMWFCSKQHCI
jgi:hypothetical protein